MPGLINFDKMTNFLCFSGVQFAHSDVYEPSNLKTNENHIYHSPNQRRCQKRLTEKQLCLGRFLKDNFKQLHSKYGCILNSSSSSSQVS